MTCLLRKTISPASLLLALVTIAPAIARAQWTPPTAEELHMTTQPEVPGAAAVYLFREEITEDKLHMWSKYVRLKVLTERGKEYANVEVNQYSNSEGGGYTISDIQGRTIHPDGVIVPFTGKPFEKLLEKGKGFKQTAKVFTLPDVEVGSILEYRYVLRYEDGIVFSPSWFIQSDLYTRKAHYHWRPTGRPLVTSEEGGGGLINTITWAPILPKGAEVKRVDLLAAGQDGVQQQFDLAIQGVPPVPDEEFMPPMSNLSYRVLFYYTPYRTGNEYWEKRGKRWSKAGDKFIGPGPKVRAAVNDLVIPSDTSDQKLRKLYAAVMKLDNTAYNRDRSAAEQKSQGFSEAKTTDDIWDRKRGTDDQMAELFVAMARAAGLKAYVMVVSDRDRSIFVPSYLSFSQLNDEIAIVVLDGKDRFFDPGQRFCPYGHLAWKHTWADGLRQTEGATIITQTPFESYKESRTDRIADLHMDDHGEATGIVKMTWRGAPALHWRQASLRGDSTSLQKDLRTAVEHIMPGGMEVKVHGIENLDDYEQPLIVTFDVKGQVASSTGKRLLVLGDIFEVNTKATFPHEKRDLPVYFEYANWNLDAVRIQFPPALAIESLPVAEKVPFGATASYSMTVDSNATSFTVHRNLSLAQIIYTREEYAELRAFYNKFESKDQETAVLKLASAAAIH